MFKKQCCASFLRMLLNKRFLFFKNRKKAASEVERTLIQLGILQKTWNCKTHLGTKLPRRLLILFFLCKWQLLLHFNSICKRVKQICSICNVFQYSNVIFLWHLLRHQNVFLTLFPALLDSHIFMGKTQPTQSMNLFRKIRILRPITHTHTRVFGFLYTFFMFHIIFIAYLGCEKNYNQGSNEKLSENAKNPKFLQKFV